MVKSDYLSRTMIYVFRAYPRESVIRALAVPVYAVRTLQPTASFVCCRTMGFPLLPFNGLVMP